METKKENYMNKYKTPEEFIYNAITVNRGNKSDCLLTKKRMIDLLREHKIFIQKNIKINYIKKSQLLEILLKKASYKELSKYVGVRSYCFEDKFNITENEIEYLRKKGIIHTTIIQEGRNIYKTYSKTFYLYDVYDYFNLTKEEINNFLDRT
ncbi:MAG: hypothetical protein J6I55_07300 [Ruminococcus sp.]|nr:hypothetical protein [Ruminococcus sp.]